MSPAWPGEALPEEFGAAWQRLDPAARRCLELAHRSLRGGGLAVGAVLTDEAGAIVTEGRNRAYDPPGGDDVLQGTPLAPAEMNALAGVRTERGLGGHVLWSSHEPCAMCAAAAAFTGVGTVRYVARDPWALATGQPSSSAEGLGDVAWETCANVLFLRGIVQLRGAGHPTVRNNAAIAPEAVRIATGPDFPETEDVAELCAALWGRIACTPS
ncbi:nucleoside deaminase [Streptomyces sp. NPDC054864]